VHAAKHAERGRALKKNSRKDKEAKGVRRKKREPHQTLNQSQEL